MREHETRSNREFCLFVMSSYDLFYILLTLISFTGTYEPAIVFIAQLVEHRTGNREVMGSNPVEVLIFFFFFQASLRNCINCVNCDDHFFIYFYLSLI